MGFADGTPSTGIELDAELGMGGLAFRDDVLVLLGPSSKVHGNETACHRDIPCGAAAVSSTIPDQAGGRALLPEPRVAGP